MYMYVHVFIKWLLEITTGNLPLAQPDVLVSLFFISCGNRGEVHTLPSIETILEPNTDQPKNT